MHYGLKVSSFIADNFIIDNYIILLRGPEFPEKTRDASWNQTEQHSLHMWPKYYQSDDNMEVE